MTAIEWVLVVWLACIPAIGLVCAICEEVGRSREAKTYWLRKRIVELEAACGISARDSWYADE